MKSAEAKGDNRYYLRSLSLSLPSPSLPFANPYRRRVHARARTAGRKAERSGQAAYPPTTWHTVTRLQSIKCVRLLWLMHYGAIKNGKYSERRAACARPATGPHSMSDEYVRAARSIAFKYNARRYRRRHARTTIRPRKRRRDEHYLRASSNFCLLFLLLLFWGRCWKVAVVVGKENDSKRGLLLFLVVLKKKYSFLQEMNREQETRIWLRVRSHESLFFDDGGVEIRPTLFDCE